MRKGVAGSRPVGGIIGGRNTMVRKLFPNRRRYTRKGVVAFYNTLTSITSITKKGIGYT